MNPDHAWQQFCNLPPDQQREVLDFMAFLQSRCTSPKPPKSPPISSEEFWGLWRGREDMEDSVRWVRKTREEEWRNCGG